MWTCYVIISYVMEQEVFPYLVPGYKINVLCCIIHSVRLLCIIKNRTEVRKQTVQLLSLSHSNVDVERLFSHVSLIKTKHRNKLKTSTVDALWKTQDALPSTSCVNYMPDSEHART